MKKFLRSGTLREKQKPGEWTFAIERGKTTTRPRKKGPERDQKRWGGGWEGLGDRA